MATDIMDWAKGVVSYQQHSALSILNLNFRLECQTVKMSTFNVLTLIPLVFWLGTFLNPPKSSTALMATFPYLQNAPYIFVDLSYSALMACTSCQVVILPHLMRWKYQFPTVLNFSKKCPLEDLGGFRVVRVKSCFKCIWKYLSFQLAKHQSHLKEF